MQKFLLILLEKKVLCKKTRTAEYSANILRTSFYICRSLGVYHEVNPSALVLGHRDVSMAYHGTLWAGV